jgi:tetratricopeptide (TPR) repeat protein
MPRFLHKIFISSTSQDLKSYRLVVKDGLVTGGVLPILQDHLTAPDPRDLMQFLHDHIRDCDAVICLIGFAFGAAPKQSTDEQPRSYTQIEYDVARKCGKPVYVFMATDNCPLDQQLHESDLEAALQKEYRQALQENHKWTPFSSADELRLRIAEMIPTLYASESLEAQPFFYLHPPSPPAFFSGRQDELQELSKVFAQPFPCVAVVSGVGGQGKSTLVDQWIKRHQTDEFVTGFAAGFWCTAHQAGFTFDNFLDQVLAYLTRDAFDKLGFEDPAARAQRLIELLQKRPSLIVVDGIERWLRGWNHASADLHSADTVGDRVGYYPVLDDFLRSASGIRNGTHLVLTTRALPAVLDYTAISMVPVGEPGMRYSLEGLSDDDAVTLLRSMGVSEEFAELRDAARGYGNHPLALTVLGGLIANGYRLAQLNADRVLDHRERLYELLEKTRINLPGGEQAERFLQVASHSIDNPSLEMVRTVLTRLQHKEPGALSRLLGRFSQSPNKDTEPDMLEMAVMLDSWHLLAWDRSNGVLTIHPVIKSFFVGLTRDSKTIHRQLAQWYSEQLVSANPVSMDHAGTRLLSIKHAVRAGEVNWAADRMFAPFTVSQTFYEWLSAWGHLSAGTTLLEEVAQAATGELRGQLLLARASLHHQLGSPQKSLKELNEVIEIFGSLDSWRGRTNLARALASRGNVYRETGRSSVSLSDFDRSIHVFEQLASKNSEAQGDLGKTLVNRGNALLDLGHWSRALADYDWAVTTYRGLAETDAKSGEPLLASALTSRGIVLAEMDEDDRAHADFSEAIGLYSKYQEPGAWQLVLRLAHVRTMLGTKLNEQGRTEEALVCFDAAVELLQPMVVEGRPDAILPLALTLMDRAKAFIASKRFESATDDATRAIAMYRGLVTEGRPQFEGSLAHAYLIRAEALNLQGDLSGSAHDRTTGFAAVRRLMVDWADESDIRMVFLQRAMNAVEYLLPVDANEATTILREIVDEIRKGFSRPPVSEAIRHEARRLVMSLQRLAPQLVNAGFDSSAQNELTRLVYGEDDSPHNQEPAGA